MNENMPKGCPFREICPIYGGNYDPYNANIKSNYKERYCKKSVNELLQKRLCPAFDFFYAYLLVEIREAIAEKRYYKN